MLEMARREIRRRNLSRKTENAYLNHIRKFLEFVGDGDLSAERAKKISGFLEYLRKSTADSTRNQARSALLFFYRDVLGQELSKSFGRIKRVRPVVRPHPTYTHAEAETVLENLHGACFLIAALMYGAGLRLAEAVRLRVRDIDFKADEIIVRDVKTGAIDRRSLLPAAIEKHLRQHLAEVEYLHEDDSLAGFGNADLPAFFVSRSPAAANEFGWQYLFPAAKLTPGEDGKNGFKRLHLAESTFHKAFAESIKATPFEKHGRCQILRYSFATRLFENRCGIRQISRLLGHKNPKTTHGYFSMEKQIVKSEKCRNS